MYTQSKFFWHAFPYLINHLFHLCCIFIFLVPFLLLIFMSLACYFVYQSTHSGGYILSCLIWDLYSMFYVNFTSNYTTFPFSRTSPWFYPDWLLAPSVWLTKVECSLQISEMSWFGNFTFLFFNFQRKASRSDSVYVGGIQREEKKSVKLYRNHLYLLFKKNINS